MKNTMIEMVVELEKLTQTEHVLKVISKAKEGYFHDYRSPATCGKMYAVQVLDWLKHTDGLSFEDGLKIRNIRKDIVEGEYDETLTDEDRVILKEQTLKDTSISEENRKFFFAAMGIK